MLAEALLQLLDGERNPGSVDPSLWSRHVRVCRAGATVRVLLVWFFIGRLSCCIANFTHPGYVKYPINFKKRRRFCSHQSLSHRPRPYDAETRHGGRVTGNNGPIGLNGECILEWHCRADHRVADRNQPTLVIVEVRLTGC